MSGGRQLSSFVVHDLLFGIDVQEVQEAIRHLEITRVPLCPRLIAGLLNLRGQIITAIDLRVCLDLPERSPVQVPVNLILRTQEGLLSLLVDEIGAVLEPGQDAFELAPSTLRGQLKGFIREIYKMPDRLLLILDTKRLLAELLSMTAAAPSRDVTALQHPA
jgi:purine-binding chemotaxis protein CheW